MKRKRRLLLAVVAGLGTAVFVWFAVEDARQATTLDARERQAGARLDVLGRRELALKLDGAPADEIAQANAETCRAWAELEAIQQERRRRENAWARLRWEIRRHTGW